MSKRYFCNPFIGKEKSLEVIDKNFYKSQVENIVKQIVARQKTGRRDLDGGLYVGAGGVAYMLYYLAQRQPGAYLPLLLKTENDMVSSTKTWIISTRPGNWQRPISYQHRLKVQTLWDFCSEDRDYLHWVLHLQKLQVHKTFESYTTGVDCHSFKGDKAAVVDKSVSLFRNCLQEFQRPDPLRCGSDEVTWFLFTNHFLLFILFCVRCWLGGRATWRGPSGSDLRVSMLWVTQKCGGCVMWW